MFEAAFDHFHLRSFDPDAAARFYVDHLGAELVDRIDTPETLRLVLVLAGIRVFIEQAPEGTSPGAAAPHRGLEHIGLTVPDIRTAVAKLEAAGVHFTMPVTERGPNLRIAFLRGPDDVLIELLERKAA